MRFKIVKHTENIKDASQDPNRQSLIDLDKSLDNYMEDVEKELDERTSKEYTIGVKSDKNLPKEAKLPKNKE